jgi:hypothetical protein
MIAIDPGQSGGIAIQKSTVGVTSVEAYSMPKTEREIYDLIEGAKSADVEGSVAYLEDLVKYTGRNMPSSAMAVYAGNFGFIKGVLTALKWRIVIVPPKEWQRKLSLGKAKGLSKSDWKNKLKQKAEELFPNIKVTLATADALLILESAKRAKNEDTVPNTAEAQSTLIKRTSNDTISD